MKEMIITIDLFWKIIMSGGLLLNHLNRLIYFSYAGYLKINFANDFQKI